MGKVTTVTCDSCKKDISGVDYQTLSIRRYSGRKHENKVAYPAVWLCDECYRKLGMLMFCLPQERRDLDE